MWYFILIVVGIVFFAQNKYFFVKYQRDLTRELEELTQQEARLTAINHEVSKKLRDLEIKLEDTFFVYELVRDISPHLDDKDILSVFQDKVSAFSGVKDIRFSDEAQNNYLNFPIRNYEKKFLVMKSSQKNIRDYIPVFTNILSLCLERVSLYNQLQELSIMDSLTQVYNRRYFLERFNREFDRAREFAFDLSFLMIDIDFFKKLNDTYGHIVGDVVLREIAAELKDNVRGIDFVARFGGEEFALILTETNKEGAIMSAQRIVKRIASKRIVAFDERIHVTVSIGIASYPEDAYNHTMLIEEADKALYQAKRNGRNTVAWV